MPSTIEIQPGSSPELSEVDLPIDSSPRACEILEVLNAMLDAEFDRHDESALVGT